MNRRNFLKSTAAVSAGLFAMNKLFSRGTDYVKKYDVPFTLDLEILTDKSGKVLERISEALPKIYPYSTRIVISQLTGKYMGDIVLIKNNRLFNYKISDDKLSAFLRNLNKDFGITGNVNEPELICISSANSSIQPRYINVYKNNILIDRHDINVQKNDLHILSDKGELYYSINDKSVRVEHSSCRHKTCEKAGAINKANQNLICIPNKIRISIDGYGPEKYDAITF